MQLSKGFWVGLKSKGGAFLGEGKRVIKGTHKKSKRKSRNPFWNELIKKIIKYYGSTLMNNEGTVYVSFSIYKIMLNQ